MRINPIKPVIRPEIYKIDDRKNTKPDGQENPQKKKASNEDLIEARLNQKEINYKKKDSKVQQNTVDQLKAESEKNHENFKRLIVQLLEKQGVKLKDTLGPHGVKVELSKEVKDNAAVAVADDGEFGPKRLSERIVSFAKALSGGDKSRIGLLRNAIEEGFSQASKKLGGLPGVSLTTYDLVMEKMDAWETEE